MCGSKAPPTAPAESAPQASDEEVKTKASSARRRRALANGGKQTIATGGLGDTSVAETGRGVVVGGAV